VPDLIAQGEDVIGEHGNDDTALVADDLLHLEVHLAPLGLVQLGPRDLTISPDGTVIVTLVNAKRNPNAPGFIRYANAVTVHPKN